MHVVPQEHHTGPRIHKDIGGGRHVGQLIGGEMLKKDTLFAPGGGEERGLGDKEKHGQDRHHQPRCGQ